MPVLNYWDGTKWSSVGSAGVAGPQGPKGDPGAPGADGLGFNPVGDWSACTDFNVRDVVTYNGSSYVQISAPGDACATPDTDPSAWQLLAAEGPQGPNCYVQTTEPAAGGVGELWIDPDGTAGPSQTPISADAGNSIKYGSDGLIYATPAVGALALQSTTPQEVNSSVYLKDTSGTAGPDKTMVYIESPVGTSGLVVGGGGNVVFGGPVSCNRNVTILGSLSVAKGGISGEAVDFPIFRSVSNQDLTLTYDSADAAGRRDRRVLFNADAAGHSIRIPSDAAQKFPIGWQVEVINIAEAAAEDDARCEINADAGVVVRWGDDDTTGGFMLSGNGASKRLRIRNNCGRVLLTKVANAGVGGQGLWIATGDTTSI